MFIKRKKQELNTVLHDIALSYMKEFKDHLMMIKWNSHGLEKNKLRFSFVVYDNKEYEQNPQCKPIKEFVGKVIAIIHRFDDIEEKWVVAPENASFTKEDIRQLVWFQEQYFDIDISM